MTLFIQSCIKEQVSSEPQNVDPKHFFDTSGYNLPGDAEDFSWVTTGHDSFGDHDGEILFKASIDSLRKITELPFRGKAEWVLQPNSNRFVLDEFKEDSESFSGEIDLEALTFKMKYSTW